MRLRTQLLLILFLLGFTPLFAMLAFNMPQIFSQLQSFYHKSHLQLLRNDFSDLDQHIARRHETIRLFAKVPVPGLINPSRPNLTQARLRYSEWVSTILLDQLDIFQIIFLDSEGNIQFWLDRDPESQELLPTPKLPSIPNGVAINMGREQGFGQVITSPLRRNIDEKHPLSMSLIAPILGKPADKQMRLNSEELNGMVIINIDVAGISRAYPETLWIYHNGDYLPGSPHIGNSTENVLIKYPDLAPILAENQMAIWQHQQLGQYIWIPLMPTQDGGPIWVGRMVDPSPLENFKQSIEIRILSIAIILLIIIIVVARWIALRTERFSTHLIEGLDRLLQDNEKVTFNWKGPKEISNLNNTLNDLAIKHAEHQYHLIEHSKKLERSNRYKSQFLANVSHELRTPLNSILLLSKLMARNDSSLDSEQRQRASVIHQAGSELITLIDDILDLSRIEANRLNIHLDVVNINSLLLEIHELFLPQFSEQKISLDLLHLNEGGPAVITDKEKLKQILKNFIANALKFCQKKTVTIELKYHKESLHPYTIAVIDQGIGIAKDHQQEIFEAFHQADSATNRRYGGTGLGLAISKRLADLLHCKIRLESQLDQGTTFFLDIPIAFDIDMNAHSQPEISATSIVELTSEHAERGPTQINRAATYSEKADIEVVIIEDDLPTLLALTPILEEHRCKITAAITHEEIIDALKEGAHIKFLFLNPQLPDIQYHELQELLRNCPDLSIILLLSDEILPKQAELDTLLQLIPVAESINKPIQSEQITEILKIHNRTCIPHLTRDNPLDI